MRKFISHEPAGVLACILVVCFTGTFIINACRKMESAAKPIQHPSAIRSQFFTLPADTDPVVAVIAASIKRQDARRDFVPQLATKAGFALWNKARIVAKTGSNRSMANREQPEQQLVLIPFARENERQTNALLLVKLTGADTLYHLLYASRYWQYGFDSSADGWNAKDIFHAFILFDKEIFGHTRFRINDRRLPGTDTIETEPVIVEITHTGSMANRGYYEETVCVDYTVCHKCLAFRGTATSSRGGQCCFPEYYTSCITWWFEDDEWDWYNSGGDGGQGSGGGSGPCSDCNWEDEESCGEDPGGPVTGFCDGGWEPAEIYDPYEAAPVILDTSITNNFPCVKKIMDSISLFLNANAWTQLALYNAFGITKKMNITFGVDRRLTKDSTDGETTRDLSHEDWDNFYATVRLNPWMLANSTHEYIAATIIHEAVHAYINYKYWQYMEGVIDSTTFKTLFPLYWPPKTVYYANNINYYDIGNSAQHQAMAASLVNIMAAPLEFVNFNPHIPAALRDSINRALAWGGLQETTVWHTKSDTCAIKAINTFARDTAVVAPFILTQGACTWVTSNHDSRTLHMKKGCQ